MAYEQSASWWCIARDNSDLADMLQTCRAIGYTAMELVPEEHFQLVHDAGMKIATHQLHGPIPVGINDPANWDDIKRQSDASLKLAQEWNIPFLIAFSGNRSPDLDDESGAENAIKHSGNAGA